MKKFYAFQYYNLNYWIHNFFNSQFTILDISQQKLRNLELINCRGEQCSPQNPNPFPLSDIGHIKNGEQCSPL